MIRPRRPSFRGRRNAAIPPFGAVSETPDGMPRLAVRVGDHALDLASVTACTPWADALTGPTLNAFLDLGSEAWAGLR